MSWTFKKTSLSSLAHPCVFKELIFQQIAANYYTSQTEKYFEVDQCEWVVRSPKSIWNLKSWSENSAFS